MIKKLFTTLVLLIALNGFTQTATEFYDRAYEYYADGKYKDCLKILDMAIRRDAITEHYLLKAETYEKLKQYQKVLETLNEGLSMYPEDPWLYNQRGFFYQRIDKPDPAIRDYGLAIKFAEENDSLVATFTLNRGTAKSSKRDFQGAYDDYMVAYEYDSTNISVLNNLAMVCSEIGKDDEVLGYLLKVVEAEPEAWFAYGNIGFAYQERGEYEKSIEYFNIVLEDNPDEPYALNNRSYSKFKLGDYEGALEDVDRSIKLFSANAFAYRNRALIYLELGKTKKACEDIAAGLEQGFTQRYGKELINLQRKHCSE